MGGPTLRGLLACGLLAAVAAPAAAQDGPDSLDALLRRVQQGWSQERVENRQREREFLERKQEQERLLREARAERRAEEERSEELERRFEENERKIAQREEQLQERLGNLGELFGVVRQVAGDTRGHLEGSLVSAQYPARAEDLAPLAESKRLPKIEQLRELWYTLLHEASEQGKVVEFPATVVAAEGGEEERSVARVGPFNAVSDGAYLLWEPSVGKLVELGRQPSGRFLSLIDDFRAAEEGLVRFAVDPSRGQILSRLVAAPTLREQLAYGGLIGAVILVLGGVAVLLAVVRGVVVMVTARRVAAQKGREEVDGGNPLGRVLGVYEENRDADAETLELKLDEAVLKESSGLERWLWAVKVISVAAPLLGLLGTVTGMINVFQQITLFGTGDPRMMAGGISQALVTTQLGLLAAIPLVLLHSWVSSAARRVVDILDEQSAGLVARKAEEERGGGAA